MITDWIGQYEVLLPINHNYNKFCDILGFLKLKTQEMLWVLILLAVKKAILGRTMAHTVQLLKHNMYCPITLSY